MKINPIIPVWLMGIICVGLCILIFNDKSFKEKISNKSNNERTNRQKELIKKFIISSVIKTLIIILLFVINLRPMLRNGDSITMTSDLGILFVVDKSVSMKALDYNGNKERIEGVKNDCCHIIDELAGCKFSIITFGDKAQRIIPFTQDADMVQAEIKAIQLEDETYAKGTSINIVEEYLEKTLKKESEREDRITDVAVIFISDGEITKEGEQLQSFANVKKYITSGAVLGYGTTQGGKMISKSYEDKPESENSYIYYYDNKTHQRQDAVSKIDENNLKKIASDLGIDYIRMDKQQNISKKIEQFKKQALDSQSSEKTIKAYQDIYFYFAIPLVILLIVNLIVQKRRIQWKER